MTSLALGNMGVFGNSNTFMSEPTILVNEAMHTKMPVELIPKEQIQKYLDAFEIVCAVNGLTPEQQEKYTHLLRYC